VNLQILPEGIVVKASQNLTLLENLLAHKIEINHSCGGMGSCGTCRVFVENKESLLNEKNEIEKEFAEERGFSDCERLSCQIHPVEGLIIRYKKD